MYSSFLQLSDQSIGLIGVADWKPSLLGNPLHTLSGGSRTCFLGLGDVDRHIIGY